MLQDHQLSRRSARIASSALLRELQAVRAEQEQEQEQEQEKGQEQDKEQEKEQGLVKEQEKEQGVGRGSRRGRGLLEMFSALTDMRTDSSLIRGGNQTDFDNRGIFDFVADVANSLLGGASDKDSAPVLIPNHCW